MINPQWLELPMSRTNLHGLRMFELMRFNCILKDNPQNVISKQKYIDYIENDHFGSFFYIAYTFLFGYNTKMYTLYRKNTTYGHFPI